MDNTSSMNPFSNVNDVFNQGTNIVTNTTSSLKEQYGSYFENNYLYIGLIAVVGVCILVGWFLYRIITTKLFLNIKEIADDTKVPIIGTEKKIIKFEYEPTGNGERRSYSFWIYIHDMSKYPNNYKRVLSMSKSDNQAELDKYSPYIFLDKTQNRMYIRFGSKETPGAGAFTYESITENNLDTIMKQGITIPYVPIQRWVHVAVVCNSNSYKNYIYAYIDGDLVNTTSTGEKDRFITGGDTIVKDLKNIDLNVSTILTIGGTASDLTNGCGFSGLVSKFTTYNYELNQKDIFDDYYSGPIGGFMAKLGLGMYGFRSPIYKL
jgi:hypothetical protein